MKGFRGFFMNKKAGTIAASVIMLGVATAALASGGEGGSHADSGVLLKDFLYRVFNFAVTVGLLAYFITKPIRKGLAGRSEGIETALNEAQASKEAAEAKFAEYDRKLAKASEEIDGIYEAIKREGELERDKILANANEMAKKVEEEAQKSAEREVAKARATLRQEATAMAVKIAEDILKKNFTGQDQSRLVDEYMKKVGELH